MYLPAPPRAIPLHFVTPAGIAKIQTALQLLAAVAPDDRDHFFRVITAVRYNRDACTPGAAACTGGRHGRTVVLRLDPAKTDLVELAVLLSHEARHHQIDFYSGVVRLRRHTCTDGLCRNPRELARDPIYRHDAWLRRELRAHLARVKLRHRIELHRRIRARAWQPCRYY